jgi:mannosyltransferase OCH1-like enzyme
MLIILTSISLIIYNIIGIYKNNDVHEKLNDNISESMHTGGYKYIPKKIFQLVRDKHNIHPKFQKNIDYIKKLNPTWRYIIYDDNDMIEYLKNNFPPEILTIYNKINPEYGAAKADFFRYLLMYNEGGVYLDVKSAMKFPLDKIIKEDDQYILAHWPCRLQIDGTNSKYGELQQWHIITKPKHPYLKSVIEQVIININNYDNNVIGEMAVLTTTGPIAYTKAIIPIIDEHPYRIFQSHENVGLVYDNTDDIFGGHKSFFSKTHYKKLKTPLILK